MNPKKIAALLLLIAVFAMSYNLHAADFKLVTPDVKVSIVYARDDKKLDSIAAHLLAKDIQRVSGYLPKVFSDLNQTSGNVIVIGTVQSELIRKTSKSLPQTLSNKWECFGYELVSGKRNQKIKNMLIIAGSDLRGTAYGVFGVSEKIGVSPWYWWADVNPVKKSELVLNVSNFVSKEPSVKFRGIFLNDEDWGLQPWAAKTFDPYGARDIGPKTYAQIFELLLRLKANLIWPAMHESTKAFYHYPENKNVAAAYEIVVSSSHAEPMLRNNVDEWNSKAWGPFNYKTNKANILNYWESRVKESRGNDVIYTMGMRGIHDGAMEGVKTTEEAVPLVEQIFSDQRNLLTKSINTDIEKVPQALSIYKEVLDIYEAGLKVPDDITLNWPDDNYGYIHRLPTPEERKRKGGSGVYYHASYWGRPHDYLWLPSANPALMREEMTKAHEMGAKTIWVLNVGDIKPIEYNTQLFLDLAYNVEPFKSPDYSAKHLQNWAGEIFGQNNGQPVAQIMRTYFDLAFERRPEFMGWSQTEPNTAVKYTDYVHDRYGDEAQKRIERYEQLEKQVQVLKRAISPALTDAFFELVEYPVKGASNINKKFLYRDKAYLYSLQGRASAKNYLDLAEQSYYEILKGTDFYNNELAGGKWRWMMSMRPRELAVYQKPKISVSKKEMSAQFVAKAEGSEDSVQQKLPVFSRYLDKKYFVDLYLTTDTTISYQLSPSASWIRVSKTNGVLSAKNATADERLWVDVDWSKAPAQRASGFITVKGGNAEYRIDVIADNTEVRELKDFEGFIESDGHIAINASSFNKVNNTAGRRWEVLDATAAGRQWVEAFPLSAKAETEEAQVLKNPSLEYNFYNFNSADAKINVYTIPTHPLSNQYEMRYALRVDDGPISILNFKTVGRSQEWKENVLRNYAIKSVFIPQLKPGKHKLSIYMVDPGVILDRIFISFDGRQLPYGTVEETFIGKGLK